MDLFPTILLASLEGLTEFLPVSSTGHLILAQQVLNLPDSDFLTTFSIAIQASAIAAVSLLYFKKIKKSPHLLTTALVAFIPTAILGLLFYSFIRNTLLLAPLVVISAIGIGGVALILAEKYINRYSNNTATISKVTYKKAFIIGLFQSLSLIPGTSRSAATIVGGLLTRLDRKTAVEFSFLTALPTISAAAAFDIYHNSEAINSSNLPTLTLGFLVSFIVAYLTMKYFLRYLNKGTLTYFGIYRIILALVSLILLL